MRIKVTLSFLLLFMGVICQAGTTGSTITYQGELRRLGVLANGTFDFQFGLFNLASGGVAVAAPVLLENIDVVDGVFTVEMDFGSAPFDGDQLWLEVGVRDGISTGGYTGLLPRQKLTAARALHAIDDADADQTNEIQDLDLGGNTLTLTGDGTTVDLTTYLDDTDDQTLADVLMEGSDAGRQSLSNAQNLTITATTMTGAVAASALDCSASANGGTLTADAAGAVSCSDDGGSVTSLDQAYDQGGVGAGRTITADSGAVAIDGDGGLILDSGDLLQLPGDPVEIGSFALFNNPVSVYVSGRYAYVIDDLANDLKVIDVSDPGAPSLAGSVFVTIDLITVYVSGRYAYVVSAGGIWVIDVSNPGAPSVAGSLALAGNPRDVYVSGRYAYVISAGSNDLKVIDVSAPGAPSVAGFVPLTSNPQSVYVSGRYAYVVDSDSQDLKVIDISDPSAPTWIGQLQPLGQDPRSVHVSGRYAYVVDAFSDDLKVVDVSDATAPSLAGSLPIGSSPESVYISGRYAYVVDSGADDLKVIDVSDPTAPSLAGSLAIGGAPTSVFVSGRYAYVGDQESDDLKVIDVSGAEITSAIAHSLEVGNLQVSNHIVAQGQVQVIGGVTIGSGGLFSGGSVGIAGDLAIVGDAFIDDDLTVGGSCIGCASDRALKRNIAPVYNALHQILQLRGVSYDWQPDSREAQYDPGPQIGVLGQEVEAVFPEMVGTDSRGYQFVRYQELVAPLIEVVKALQAESEALEARLATLEREFD